MKPELGFIDGAGIALNPNGTLKTDPATMATSVDGVFAAGDAATGPSIVAGAIGQGREAALAVHRFLTGAPKAHEVLLIGEGGRFVRSLLRARGRPTWSVSVKCSIPNTTGRRPGRRVASQHRSLSRKETPVSARPLPQRRSAAFTAATAISAASAWRTAPGSSWRWRKKGQRSGTRTNAGIAATAASAARMGPFRMSSRSTRSSERKREKRFAAQQWIIPSGRLSRDEGQEGFFLIFQKSILLYI